MAFFKPQALLRSILIICCFAVTFQMTFSQVPQPTFRHLGVNEGLPSSEAYDVVQDFKGYMWIGTDMGLVCYDGYEFKTFTTDDNLPDNTIFGIKVMPDGRLLLRNFLGIHGYFDGKQFTPIPTDEQLIKIFKQRPASIPEIHSDGSIVYPSMVKGYFLKIGLDGKFEFLPIADSLEDHHMYVTIGEGGDLNYSYRASRFAPLDYRITLNVSFPDTSYQVELAPKKILDKGRMLVRKVAEGEYVLAFMNTLCRFNRTGVLWDLELGQNATCLERLDEDRFAVGILSKGAWIFSHKSGPEPIQKVLVPYSVTGLNLDHEGGIWITTLEGGLYTSRSLAITNYSRKQMGKTDKLHAIALRANGQLWASYTSGDIMWADSAGGQMHLFSEYPTSDISLALLSSKNGDFWIGSRPLQVIGLDEKLISPTMADGSKNFWRPGFFYEDSKGRTWMDGTDRMYYVEPGEYEIRKGGYLGNLFRPRGITEWKGSLWVGGLLGLASYSDDTLKSAKESHPALQNRITDLCVIQDKLILGTRGLGLLVWDGHQMDSISIREGLPGNMVNAFVQDSNRLWVATNQGVGALHFHQEGYSIESYTRADGLPSNEIRSILKQGDSLWLATEAGITCLPLGNTAKPPPPPVYITGITAGGKSRSLSENIELSYSENDVQFDWTGISFGNPNKRSYKFQLQGQDREWRETSNRSILYADLPAGSYTFQVIAYHNGVSSPISARVSFFISAPFWQRWWFLLLCGSALVLLAVQIIHWVTRSLNRRSDLKRKIAEAKLSALQSQMNPHFIFNAMNSIQSFVIRSQPKEAYEYLAKFASLIRMNLASSRKGKISLEQEIESLELYLELEALRFDEKLQYHFDLGGITSPKSFIKLPTMLIQPLIENAILHGIMPKQEGGNLWVKIREIPKALEVEVSDDGVGLEAAQAKVANRPKKRKSEGLNLIRERLQLLDHTNSNLAKLEIKPRMSGNSKLPNGTIVQLTIPT